MSDTIAALLNGYLKPGALAFELDVSVRTLERWHSQRIGPPRTKIGNKVLYRKEAVRAWLEAQEQFPVRERRKQRRVAH